MDHSHNFPAVGFPRQPNHAIGSSGDVNLQQAHDGTSSNSSFNQQYGPHHNGMNPNSLRYTNQSNADVTTSHKREISSQHRSSSAQLPINVSMQPARVTPQTENSFHGPNSGREYSHPSLTEPQRIGISTRNQPGFLHSRSSQGPPLQPSSSASNQYSTLNHSINQGGSQPKSYAAIASFGTPSSHEKSIAPPFSNQDQNLSSSQSLPPQSLNPTGNDNAGNSITTLPHSQRVDQHKFLAPGPPNRPPGPPNQPPGPPNQHYSISGAIRPPPLTGQHYQPPVQLGSVAPPPLPGQVYTSQSSSPSANSVEKLQSSTLPPPPLSGSQQQSAESISASYNQPQIAAQPSFPTGFQQPSLAQQQFKATSTAQNAIQNLASGFGAMGVNDACRPVNLLQETRILPIQKPADVPLRFEAPNDRTMLVPPDRKNCHPEVFRCTLKAIPHTQNLLHKVKMPLGLVVHPFKDLNSLPVITAGTDSVIEGRKSRKEQTIYFISGSIVRCKRCRTYINPFVNFIDERRWRCNMCFAVNDAPEEFLHHPVSKTYGEPHTRPECTNSTIEFIAPQEYMIRPPQPAVYLFLMDVSHSAVESGYLQIVCNVLLDRLESLPGDSRMQIGFLTYNQTVHFYRLNDGLAQPQMMIVSDIDDVFVPTPENLLINLRESKDLVEELLHQLPLIHSLDVGEVDTYSALGSALEVAKKMMSSVGGRITVFQHSLPSTGPGKLDAREDPNIRAGEIPTTSLNPATDYYKKLALDCSASQVAVDFFFFNSHYVDIATLSCSSRFSAGDVHYYPGLHLVHNPNEAKRLSRDFERYLTRKIGFESVMRIRCTKGLNIHTFHGNFFVRSTDLLTLANVSPDAGFAVNLAIEDPLTDLSAVCFQAALLYTTSKGERRIRVHTMCIPVVKTAAEVLNAVDCVAVVSLLSKMAVDRSVTATISDARDALVNAVIDPLRAYKETLPQGMTTGGVYVPPCLRLFPLYIHCLMKNTAFRLGISTKLDDRVFAMINLKMQPAAYLLQDVHPDLYRVDDLHDERKDPDDIPRPSILPLSAESISQSGTFLLDCGWSMYLYVGRSTRQDFIKQVLGFAQFSFIEDPMYEVPQLKNSTSELFHTFIESLLDRRPHHAPIRVIRDDSRDRLLFHCHLYQDRYDNTKSLQDFLLHIQQKLN